MNNYGSRTYDTTNALGHPARDGSTPQFQRYATQAQEAPGNDSMSRLQGIASDVVNGQQGAAEGEHIVGVMIQDESGQSIQRRIKVGGAGEQEAVARARTHYTNHGYRVLDAWYMSPYGGAQSQGQSQGQPQMQTQPQMQSQPRMQPGSQSAPVQEISDDLRNRYVKRASQQWTDAETSIRLGAGSPNQSGYASRQRQIANRRRTGLNRALNDRRTGREETREMFADQQEEFYSYRLHVQLQNEAGDVVSRTFKTRASSEEEAIDNAEVYYNNRGLRLLGAEVDEE